MTMRPPPPPPTKPWYKQVASWVWGVLGGIVIAMTAILLWRSKKRGPSTYVEAHRVQKLRNEIAKTKAERSQAVKDVKARQPEIEAIDKRITQHKRSILEIEKRSQALMTDAEVAQVFDSLGYLIPLVLTFGGWVGG